MENQNEEVEEFSDNDLISERYELFKARGVKARAEILAPTSKSDFDEVAAARIYVAKTLDEDRSIVRYDDPTDAEMQDILDRAASYEGDWYHTHVRMEFNGEWTPLQRKIADLPPSSGVYQVHSWATLESAMKYFGIRSDTEEISAGTRSKLTQLNLNGKIEGE